VIEARIAAYLIGLLVLLGGGGYAGWTARDWKAAADERAEKRTQELILKTKADAALGTAEAIAKLEPKLVTLKEKVTREVIEKPIYRDCVHSANGLRDINAALTAQPGNPFGDRGLPVPDAAGEPVIRGDDTEAR
jgi:hypothetical protein